ncbi:MAG: hypothetical protein ACOYXB_16820 [Bacteroidota bacterium]
MKKNHGIHSSVITDNYDSSGNNSMDRETLTCPCLIEQVHN